MSTKNPAFCSDVKHTMSFFLTNVMSSFWLQCFCSDCELPGDRRETGDPVCSHRRPKDAHQIDHHPRDRPWQNHHPRAGC